MDTKTFESLWERQSAESLHDFFHYLSMESVSAASEYKPKLLQTVGWLGEYLTGLGFRTEIWETPGHPVLFAERSDGGPEAPTVLIYNHYDVQPVDPLELWNTPPFEPAVRDGAVYARGAQDNKGQTWCVLGGLKLLLERDGALPVNVKLFIEGEEEIGSPSVSSVLETKADRLRADYLMIQDCLILGEDQPAVTLGIRGLVCLEVTLTSASTDLHSGCHGGAVYNPNRALAEMIASLWDENGKVTVPGFYDSVKPVGEGEIAEIDLRFDDEAYLRDFGARATAMEKGLSPNEARWMRPTVEVNGMWGGYIGEGVKTIIPAKASAKLTCRLVPAQEPRTTAELVLAHLESQCPDGVQFEGTIRTGGGRAVRTSASSRISQAARQAYSEVWQKPCSFILEGSTIPVVASLAAVSGGETALLGFGLASDAIHAPNEHFSLERLRKGSLVIGRLLELLGSPAPDR